MTVILKFNALLPATVLRISALVPLMIGVMLTPVVLASDPTRPEVQLEVLVTAEATAVPVLPRLSMIRSQGSRYQALIDGQWLKAGENIGAYQVRSISASQVILVQGERSLVLHLFQTITTTK